MIDKNYELYILAEIAYKKVCTKNNIKEDDMFPDDWYRNTNYEYKTKILIEALHNNILIKDTNEYKNFIERVL